MKKKIVLVAILTVLAVLCALCVIFYLKQQKAQARIAQVPGIELQTADGQTANLADVTRGAASVILFFHPQCAFCGMEMKEILAHQDELEDVHMVFVTTAEGDELAGFLAEYPIGAMQNGAALVDYDRDFVLAYNIKSPPTCYIYDRDQKLRKTIRGTVPVSEILKTINNLR